MLTNSILKASNRLFSNVSPILIDKSSFAVQFDMEKCCNCQTCVKICRTVAGQNVLVSKNVNGRDIIQTKSGKLLNDTNCIGCGQCTLNCNVGVLREADATEAVYSGLKNKNGKVAVCQVAPAIRVNIAECICGTAGCISTGKLVTALKLLGFDYVFDTNFTADLTICEEATELLQRLGDKKSVFPMFTSCCPAWINYVEKNDPSLIPNLSSCRSPMGMLSGLIRSDFAKVKGIDPANIFNVAIMPCTAKKDEIERPQLKTDSGVKETDHVLTSRELAKMIKDSGIDYMNLPDTPFDSLYDQHTGSAAIFCASGGVMEAAVRAAHKFVTQRELDPIELTSIRGVKDGIKIGSVNIDGTTLNVAVAHGIKNAMTLIQKMRSGEPQYKDLHFVEVMACPGGCVCGGGSPKAKNKKIVETRIQSTYSLDKNANIRTSQDNPSISELYKRYLGGKYNSHEAHHILHTHYSNRKK